MDKPFQSQPNGPLRKSLFTNIPPYLNYLPNGKDDEEVGACQEHTDTMVDLRECLWRVPVAFTSMVAQEERERMNKEKCCKITNTSVSLPSAFTREKNTVKRKGIFRPRSIVIEEDLPSSTVLGGNKGYFTQQHNDAKVFMEEHFQVKISPFPSCHQIARKDHLWHNFKKMQQKYGNQHFNFLSDSFIIPEEKQALVEKMEQEPGSMWIVKPPGKNNGSGIFVIDNPEDIPNTDESVLVQRYITNPYLIRRCKFDLRVYVLVTGVDPLKIYIYDEGLVRFAVNDFTLDPELIKDNRIHVTNFDVNKRSDKFIANTFDPLEPEGHKWTLTALWKYLSHEVKDHKCLDLFQIWQRIQEVVIKSILCGLTAIKSELLPGRKKEMRSTYNFYKLFGYDIMLDNQCHPKLIEINSRPAALSDKLDSFVNRPMVGEMFRIVGYHIPPNAVSSPDRKSIASGKLNIARPPPFHLSFNPMQYSTMGTSNMKEGSYDRNNFDRSTYLSTILDSLNGSDIRCLVKYLEERSQTYKFCPVFPNRNTHKYFQFMDYLSYHDKLLDAFEDRFGFENIQEGIEYVESYCKNNAHI